MDTRALHRARPEQRRNSARLSYQRPATVHGRTSSPPPYNSADAPSVPESSHGPPPNALLDGLRAVRNASGAHLIPTLTTSDEPATTVSHYLLERTSSNETIKARPSRTSSHPDCISRTVIPRDQNIPSNPLPAPHQPGEPRTSHSRPSHNDQMRLATNINATPPPFQDRQDQNQPRRRSEQMLPPPNHCTSKSFNDPSQGDSHRPKNVKSHLKKSAQAEDQDQEHNLGSAAVQRPPSAIFEEMTTTIPHKYPSLPEIEKPQTPLTQQESRPNVPLQHHSTRSQSPESRSSHSELLHASPKHQEHHFQRTTSPQAWWKLVFCPILLLLYILSAIYGVAPLMICHHNITIDASRITGNIAIWDNWVTNEAIHKVWTNTSVLTQAICALDNAQCYLRSPDVVDWTELWYKDRQNRHSTSSAFPISCPRVACRGNPTESLHSHDRSTFSRLMSNQTRILLETHFVFLSLGDIAYSHNNYLENAMARLVRKETKGRWYGFAHAQALFDVPENCVIAEWWGCDIWQPAWNMVKFVQSYLFLPDGLEQENVRRLEEAEGRLKSLPNLDDLYERCTENMNNLLRTLHKSGFTGEAEGIGLVIEQACNLPNTKIHRDRDLKDQALLANSLRAQIKVQRSKASEPFALTPLVSVPGAVVGMDGRRLSKKEKNALIIERVDMLMIGSPEAQRSIRAYEHEKLGWE